MSQQMLVLTRRSGETIVIRDGKTRAELARLTVNEVWRGKTRIGFEAPPEIVINREEVDQEAYPEFYPNKCA